jgi:phosphatidylserine decarboxylase
LSLFTQSKKRAFIAFQQVVPQHQLSRVVGWLAASEQPLIKQQFIQRFAKQYDIDMSLAAQPDLASYPSFNAFFTRELKDGARPIDSDDDSIVSPADGAISQLGKIKGDAVFQAKGQSFSVEQLIGDTALAAPFQNGEFATVYLSPRDYHRVHMPYAGRLTDTLYIPGELFSVNGVTAENVPALFARNERMVCLFDIDVNGQAQRMAVVLVGAMIVAGIETVATGKAKPTGRVEHQHHDLYLEKGAELGRFYLGSTAVVLFEPNAMEWSQGLMADDVVRMGEKMGQLEA